MSTSDNNYQQVMTSPSDDNAPVDSVVADNAVDAPPVAAAAAYGQQLQPSTSRIIDVCDQPKQLTSSSPCCDDIKVTSSKRRDSTTSSSGGGSSSSEASSVDVNCSAFPTEVIVHGRKVQKVRVLFTPQPPQKVLSASIERRRVRRPAAPSAAGQGRHRLKSVTSDAESGTLLPFSQEESAAASWSMPDRSSMSIQARDGVSTVLLPRVTSLPEPLVTSSSSSYIQNASPSVLGSIQTPAAAAAASDRVRSLPGNFTVDCPPPAADADVATERTIRQNLLNWFDFLERRKGELQTINNQLVLERDALKMDNDRLRELIDDNQLRFDAAAAENDELKAKLDRMEKEVTRLSDQALNEWKSRVKAEEQYAQLKHQSAEELRALQVELNHKVEENRSLLTDNKENNQPNNRDGSDSNSNNNRKSSRDLADSLELLCKISTLEETVQRFRADRERLSEEVGRLERDTVAWKERFESKCREFDVQATRFESLRRSYNHLLADNEQLRSQFVLRRSAGTAGSKSLIDVGSASTGSGGVAASLNNLGYWPKSAASSSGVIDLSDQSRNLPPPPPSLSSSSNPSSISTSSSSAAHQLLHTVQFPAVNAAANGSNPTADSNPAAVVVTRRPSSKDLANNSSQKLVSIRRRKSDESAAGGAVGVTGESTLPHVLPNKFVK